jgi:hypothetical protein
MLLSGVLFVLILAGCWVYCLIDAALTPAVMFRDLPKAAWIAIIALTFVLGGIAWLAYRSTLPARPGLAPGFATGSRATPAGTYIYWHPDWGAAAEAAAARHPAGRSLKTPADGWTGPKATGPDDDPEFLRELDRRIKGAPGEDAE